MAQEFEYPFVPGIGGLPFKDISLGYNDKLFGASNRILHCCFSETEILFEDNIDPWFRISANVDDRGELSLGLHTRRNLNDLHPDFFASKFIDYALNHFNHFGIEINHFRAEWLESYSGATNYDQYMKHWRATHKRKESAKQTWTYKQMSKYGFTKIDKVIMTTRDPGVTAILLRA